jgi:hypothetical protein
VIPKVLSMSSLPAWFLDVVWRPVATAQLKYIFSRRFASVSPRLAGFFDLVEKPG